MNWGGEQRKSCIRSREVGQEGRRRQEEEEEEQRGADNKKTVQDERWKSLENGIFARFEETWLYVLIYNAEFVFLSTEKAQLRDPYVYRAPVVVPSFHPWKSPSFIHDPRCSDLHSVWWGAQRINGSPTLKGANFFFFLFHRLSSSHTIAVRMVGVSVLYMYTMALSFKPSLTFKKKCNQNNDKKKKKKKKTSLLHAIFTNKQSKDIRIAKSWGSTLLTGSSEMYSALRRLMINSSSLFTPQWAVWSLYPSLAHNLEHSKHSPWAVQTQLREEMANNPAVSPWSLCATLLKITTKCTWSIHLFPSGLQRTMSCYILSCHSVHSYYL